MLPVASRYYDLTYSQAERLSNFLTTHAEWSHTHTCVDWARDGIYHVTGDYIDVDDYFGFETPRELSKQNRTPTNFLAAGVRGKDRIHDTHTF